MNITGKAKIKVDLTPIKKGVVECDACIEGNSLDQPEAITLDIGGLNAEQINLFCQPTLSVKDVFGNPHAIGVLEAGGEIEGEIVFIKSVSFGAESVQLGCYLGEVTRECGQEPKGQGDWVFGLSNYRISIGDQRTDLPLPAKQQASPKQAEQFNALTNQWHEAFPNSGIPKSPPATPADLTVKPGWRQNRITFSFAGRSWTLDDDLFGRWPKDDQKISEPVRSGILMTAYQGSDTDGAIQQIVDDISELLSLALGRDVKWVECGRQQDDGSVQSLQSRNPGLLPFNQHGSRLADNWTGGNLKRFLESGEGVVAADREWWAVTVGLLTQARGAKYVEVKCSLLNTLLDRITTKVLGETNTPEIDAGLDAKVDVKEFRVTLHYILATLAPNWDRTRTDALCSTIKDWNAKPSFPKKIIRACQKHGISPISGKKLGFRHVLIHEGEMHSDLKTPDDRAQYFFEIEMIVLLLLVRMLGFDGEIYLQCKPPDPKPVGEFLVDATQPNGGK